jgi:hypothetical protein
LELIETNHLGESTAAAPYITMTARQSEKEMRQEALLPVFAKK